MPTTEVVKLDSWTAVNDYPIHQVASTWHNTDHNCNRVMDIKNMKTIKLENHRGLWLISFFHSQVITKFIPKWLKIIHFVPTFSTGQWVCCPAAAGSSSGLKRWRGRWCTPWSSSLCVCVCEQQWTCCQFLTFQAELRLLSDHQISCVELRTSWQQLKRETEADTWGALSAVQTTDSLVCVWGWGGQV